MTASKRFPVSNDTKDCLTGTSDSDILGTSQSLRFDGIVSLGSGALLTSLLICCMLVYFIDRNFKYFSASSVIAALFSLFGLIHSTEIALLAGKDDYGWRFAVGYSLCAAFGGLLWLGQYAGYVDIPVVVAGSSVELKRSSFSGASLHGLGSRTEVSVVVEDVIPAKPDRVQSASAPTF